MTEQNIARLLDEAGIRRCRETDYQGRQHGLLSLDERVGLLMDDRDNYRRRWQDECARQAREFRATRVSAS